MHRAVLIQGSTFEHWTTSTAAHICQIDGFPSEWGDHTALEHQSEALYYEQHGLKQDPERAKCEIRQGP